MTTRKAPEIGDNQSTQSKQSMLQKLLNLELKRPTHDIQEMNSSTLVGRLEGFDEEGWPIVSFVYEEKAYRKVARSTVELTLNHVGRECLVQFSQGSNIPIVSGLLQPPLLHIEQDNNESKVIHSDGQILLQCGDAYIELNPEGVIRIRGNYVESVAYGVNRLKGSSVKIN